MPRGLNGDDDADEGIEEEIEDEAEIETDSNEPDADIDDEGDGDADEGSDDQGSDDDDGEDEEGESEGRQAPVERAPSRGENRVARAAREAKEAKEELAAARRELEAARGSSQTAAQAEAARRRQEHLDSLDGESRVLFLQNEASQRLEQRIARMEFNSWDTGDRVRFEGRCAREPALQRISKEVEDKIADLRSKGQTTDRETVAAYLIGMKALTGAGRAKTKLTKTAAASKARQQSKPGNSRGDVSTGGGKRGSEQEARRKRLENMEI